MTPADRIAAALSPGDVRGPWQGCWEWTGATYPSGHGNVRVQQKGWLVHRAVFEAIYGYLPAIVMHACDNPACFRPDHLRPAESNAENMADMVAKRRHHKHQVTHCPQGHEYEGENVRLDRCGYRICVLCSRANNARHKARKRAEKRLAREDGPDE